jgi:tyrosyl-tRNA synthetase
MSSSVGNNIPLTLAPEEIFGRTMRIPDEMLPDWWRLVADRDVPDADAMSSKLALARWIVARSHGDDAAAGAEEHFTRVVRRHEAPDEVPDVRLPDGELVHLPALLVASFGVGSTSEARRLIGQGGVKLDGEPVVGVDVVRADVAGKLLQVGKRRFGRLV